MPLPWHPALIAEGLPTAIVAGVAGGVLGALFAGGLRGELPARRTARLLAHGAAPPFLIVGANALVHSEQSGVRATVALRPDGRRPRVRRPRRSTRRRRRRTPSGSTASRGRATG